MVLEKKNTLEEFEEIEKDGLWDGQVGKGVQGCVRVIASRPDDLSLTPKIDMTSGELTYVGCSYTSWHMYIHIRNKLFN